MEPPSKRLKLGQALYDSDEEEMNQDELSMNPFRFDAQQDPMYQLDKGRAKAATRLKSTFESIFEKYERDFTDEGDEIDLETGEVIVNNGHLQSLQDEKDRDREGSDSSEEEERILRGKEIQPAKQSDSKSLMPAKPSAYNRTQVSDSRWNMPPGLDGGDHRLSSLAFPQGPFGSAGPFSFGSPLFGNSTVDPAWQAPDLPLPVQNGYGFGFGGPRMGYSQALAYGQASFMRPGNHHNGSLSSLFHYQAPRKLGSAHSFMRKSLPATTTSEQDEEEDDILFSQNTQSISKTIPVKETENSLPSVAVSVAPSSGVEAGKEGKHFKSVTVSRDLAHIEQRGRGRPPKEVPTPKKAQSLPIPDHATRGAGATGETGNKSHTTEEAALHTQRAQNALPKPRQGIGRRKKTDTLEPSQTSHDTNDNDHAPIEIGTGIQAHHLPEKPRRGSGRSKKPVMPGQSGRTDGENNGEQSSRVDVTTGSQPPAPNPDSPTNSVAEIPTPSPPPKAQETVNLAKKPALNKPHNKTITSDKAEPSDLDVAHRRSSRARQPTQFYGKISWLKRGARPPKDMSEESSQVPQVPEDGSPRRGEPSSVVDSQMQETEEATHTGQGEKVGQDVIADGTLAEQNREAEVNTNQPDQEMIGDTPEEDSPPADNLTPTRASKPSETMDRQQLESSLPTTIADVGDTETPSQDLQSEVFTRNELGPSENVSDEENDEVQRPADPEKQTPLNSEARQIEDGEAASLGDTKALIPPNDIAGDQTPGVSGLLETAEAKPAPESQTDAAREPVVTEKPVEETDHQVIDESPDHAPEPVQRTETVIPQQDSGHDLTGAASGRGEQSPAPLPSVEKDIAQETEAPTRAPRSRKQKKPRRYGLPLRPSSKPTGDNSNPSAGNEQSQERTSRQVHKPAISNIQTRVPETPKSSKHSETAKRRLGNQPKSSAKRKPLAFSTLIPDNPDDDDDDEDELSILPSSSYTPTLFRSKLSGANRHSATPIPMTTSTTTTSTPRRSKATSSASTSRRHSLLVGPRTDTSTPGRVSSLQSTLPATDSRVSRGRVPKRKYGGSGSSTIQSSPLARTAAQNSFFGAGSSTPRNKRRTSPTMTTEEEEQEGVVRTPGGTMRRCGEDGFVCERDFCLTCCR